ncbi:MAG TPA: pentapeptide repeat-containing protein [Syntrophorhabdaceae bacterium]
MSGSRLSFLSAMALICLFFSFTVAGAFDEKQLKDLRKSNNCAKCDLTNAKLGGLDLSYADLSSSNLTGADLSNCTFYSANLSKANLTGANLTGANLYDTNLSGANVTKANLTKANLHSAKWINGKSCKQGSIGECKQ